LAAGAKDVDEHAIAALVMKPVDRFLKDAVVVQRRTSLAQPFN
jgi:hypothetical protein